MFQLARSRWPSALSASTVCLRCLSRPNGLVSRRRFFSAATVNREAIGARSEIYGFATQEYFSANGNLPKGQYAFASPKLKDSTPGLKHPPSFPHSIKGTQTPKAESSLETFLHVSEPPHRRRKRLKEQAAAAAIEAPLPPDAPSRLTTSSATLPARSFRRLLTTCLALSKPRLSFLIVLTTAATYAIYPVPTLLLPATTATPSLSALTLVFLTMGTALTCASANSLNMLMEPKYDAQMSRTRNRPLVRGLIGKRGALVFAGLAGLLGVGSLYVGVNPTVAFLGGLNIFLYAGVYTPMKRLSVLNTWIGAVVGAIPPLMGWAAAAGQSASGTGEWKELLFSESSIGGWLVAGLLFAWQFPHFNSLSWPIREEYKNAGYRMLAWTNARMNGRVALRYSLLMFPICFGLVYFDITDQGFFVTSSVVNAWMAREAWRFWRNDGFKGSARALFWASIWHLPVVMVLAMVHKKGLWEGVWKRLANEIEEDDTMASEGERIAPTREMSSHVACSK